MQTLNKFTSFGKNKATYVYRSAGRNQFGDKITDIWLLVFFFFLVCSIIHMVCVLTVTYQLQMAITINIL